MEKTFIITATKSNNDFVVDGIMHIPAKSKRKAKKTFKQQYKGWKISEIVKQKKDANNG